MAPDTAFLPQIIKVRELISIVNASYLIIKTNIDNQEIEKAIESYNLAVTELKAMPSHLTASLAPKYKQEISFR